MAVLAQWKTEKVKGGRSSQGDKHGTERCWCQILDAKEVSDKNGCSTDAQPAFSPIAPLKKKKSPATEIRVTSAVDKCFSKP